MNESEKKYYELCAQMLQLLNEMHANSRRYIRRSLWNLLFTPFVMVLLLVVTEISKGALLFLWLAALFLTCGFLVFIEYIDTRMMKQARALIGEDTEWLEILEKNEKLKKKKGTEDTSEEPQPETPEASDAEAVPEAAAAPQPESGPEESAAQEEPQGRTPEAGAAAPPENETAETETPEGAEAETAGDAGPDGDLQEEAVSATDAPETAGPKAGIPEEAAPESAAEKGTASETRTSAPEEVQL